MTARSTSASLLATLGPKRRYGVAYGVTLATTLWSSSRRSTTRPGSPRRRSRRGPADSASSGGVLTVTPRMRARPSFSRAASACVRPRDRRPAAERLVELERLGERPAVLERVEAARGHQRSRRRAGRARAAHPRAVRAGRRSSGSSGRGAPRRPARPHEPGAARAEQPLVAAGRRRRRRRGRPATRPRRRSRARRRRRAGSARSRPACGWRARRRRRSRGAAA